MDLTVLSVTEIIQLYSQSIKELKRRQVLRTKNVLGDLGEYLVFDHYAHHSELPILNRVPVGTQNINALSQDGKRYAIKSTSGHVTGVFYGLEAPGSFKVDVPIFEYVIICRFDDDYLLENIYQIDWETFVKHKKWHSRMKAWNLTLTQSLISDSTVVFDRNNARTDEALGICGHNMEGDKCVQDQRSDVDFSVSDTTADADVLSPLIDNTVAWCKEQKINHSLIRDEVSRLVAYQLRINLIKDSHSRFISDNNQEAVFIMSSKFSERNNEYWYSIADEIIPWLKNYPRAYVAFALGSSKHVLLFDMKRIISMLKGCLHTKEDVLKNKKAHYHFSFAVEGKRTVYFKKKLPEHEFINVSDALLRS